MAAGKLEINWQGFALDVQSLFLCVACKAIFKYMRAIYECASMVVISNPNQSNLAAKIAITNKEALQLHPCGLQTVIEALRGAAANQLSWAIM